MVGSPRSYKSKRVVQLSLVFQLQQCLDYHTFIDLASLQLHQCRFTDIFQLQSSHILSHQKPPRDISSPCSPSLVSRFSRFRGFFSFLLRRLCRLKRRPFCLRTQQIHPTRRRRPTGSHQSNGRVLWLLEMLHLKYFEMSGIMAPLVSHFLPLVFKDPH